MSYDVTKSRALQWLGIIAILCIFGGAYWYYSVRAGVTVNTSQNDMMTSGLVGLWSFDGGDVSGTTAYDRSGSGNNGTLVNGPTVTRGQVGQALNFDGTDDYASISDVDSLDAGTGSFTYGTWFKTSSTSQQRIISKRIDPVAPFLGYELAILDTGIVLCTIDDDFFTYLDLRSVNAYNNGIWHQVFCVIDKSSGSLRLYIDGVQVPTTLFSGTNDLSLYGSLSNSSALYVGRYSAQLHQYFAGSLDEVRIYNRALSATEIQSLYALGQSDKINSAVSQPQGTGRLDSGLAGYWKLDENTGTSAGDSSTNGNTGTLTNGPTWTTGQIGSAVDFDGTDDYVTVADTGTQDITDGRDFTLSGWFNRDIFTTDDTIIAKRNGQATGDTGYIVYIDDATDDIIFEVSDGTDEYSRSSTSTFTATGWNHFTAVYQDAVGMSIYINGTLDQDSASGTLTNVNSLANAVAFRLGAESDAGNPFDGKLDEMRLYHRALSADEVVQLYRLTSPTYVDATLDAYWSFDGNTISGTTLYDRSGTGKNGTLMNGVAITTGKMGQALNFDGVDDRVNVATVVTGTTFTITAWIFPRPGGPNYGHIFGQDVNNTFEFHNSNNKLTMNSNGVYNDSNTALPDNEWSFVGISVTAGNGTFYLNGNPDGTKNGIGSKNFVDIGWNANGEYFNGKIDELRFYSRALTTAEMRSLYTAGQGVVSNSGNSQPEGGSQLDSGLALYYALDDGTSGSTPTTAVDASTNGNTGTLTSGPTWTTGKIGSAVDFDGTDDYITAPDSDSIDIVDARSFTLSGWFNRDTFAADHTIIAKSNGQTATDTGYIVYVDDTTDKLVFNASDGTDRYQLASASSFTSSGWQHFAVVWREHTTSAAQLYINGYVQSATATGTIANVNSLANALALRIGSESDAGNPFDGKLDEIRLYNRPFSSTEVLSLYLEGFPTGTDTSLKGYWSFNGKDISGTTAYDRSGSGNTGTLTNGPTQTIGKLGQGLKFDGVDDHVTLSTFNETFSNMTITAWVRPESFAAYNGIVFTRNYPNDGGLWLSDVWPSTTLAYRWKDGLQWDSGLQLPQDEWSFVALTVSPALGTVYVGTSTGLTSAANVTTHNPAVFDDLKFGRDDDAPSHWDGGIDEVRIYNRVLSADEIKSLYNQAR